MASDGYHQGVVSFAHFLLYFNDLLSGELSLPFGLLVSFILFFNRSVYSRSISFWGTPVKVTPL